MGLVNAPTGCVFAILQDITRKKQYDAMFETGAVLETLNEFTLVGHEVFSGMWGVSGRDFVVCKTFETLADGTIMSYAQSVSYPNCPALPGKVRGTVTAGFIISPIPGKMGCCKIVYVASVDLKGLVLLFFKWLRYRLLAI